MRTRRLVLSGLLGVAMVVPLSLTAPAAYAAPSKGLPVTLTCGSTTYHVIVPGSANWEVAHDLDSNRIFIPDAFTEETGTVYDSHGAVVNSFTEPASSKGGGHVQGDTTCSFVITIPGDGSDPFIPAGGTLVVHGGVIGRIVAG
jgi:hypothetical protein